MAYVMMAIPAELVPAVTEFVESGGFPPAASRDTQEPDGFVHGWDPAAVRRAYRESGDRMRRVLRFLAGHPDVEVSSEEIADAINARYGWNTVAGMLGALGRRSKNRYGRTEPMWEHRYTDDGRILLTMPSAAAKTIREIADTEPQSFN
jgi:hypothetical protein